MAPLLQLAHQLERPRAAKQAPRAPTRLWRSHRSTAVFPRTARRKDAGGTVRPFTQVPHSGGPGSPAQELLHDSNSASRNSGMTPASPQEPCLLQSKHNRNSQSEVVSKSSPALLRFPCAPLKNPHICT